MAARKAAVSLAVSASGFSGGIVSGPPHAGVTAEKTLIAAFGDNSKTAYVSDVVEYKDIVITVLDEGAVDPPLAGDVAEFTITTGYDNGSGTPVERTFTRTCYVQDIEPEVVEVDGQRRAAYTMTLSPQGGDDPDSVGFGVSES